MMPEPGASGTPPAVEDSSRERPPWRHRRHAGITKCRQSCSSRFAWKSGFFLLVFPWTEYWDANYLSRLLPAWQLYWGNMYVRGAISGLGVVNLYISFIEIFRLRRFSRR